MFAMKQFEQVSEIIKSWIWLRHDEMINLKNPVIFVFWKE